MGKCMAILMAMNEAFQFFRESIRALHPALSEEEWSFMRSQCRLLRLARRSHFIEVGMVQEAIGFVHNIVVIRGLWSNFS